MERGLIAYSSWPSVPSGVAIRFGLWMIASAIMSAAFSGVIVGKRLYSFVGAIIGVRTSGMWIVVIVTPSSIISEATARDHASSAAFDATYAENRGVFVCTPIELMLTMCPCLRSRILGSSFSI